MEEKVLVKSLPFHVSELAPGMIFAEVSILCFFAPFGLGHPQWLVGTAVNACLFLTALFLPKKYFLPMAILPSLGVLARGLVFGPLTLFLVYFLPFIWLGNLILILVFKNYIKLTAVKNAYLNFVLVILVASVVKFLFLFLIANFYFKFHFAPKLFLTTMGLNQLATALAGGLISFLFFKIYAGSRRIS